MENSFARGFTDGCVHTPFICVICIPVYYFSTLYYFASLLAIYVSSKLQGLVLMHMLVPKSNVLNSGCLVPVVALQLL